MIKKFNDFNKVEENVELAQPMVKPATPTTKPITRPGRPSPYRKDRPSVVPKPKATAEDLSNKFLNLTKADKDVKSFLKEKYLKKEGLNEWNKYGGDDDGVVINDIVNEGELVFIKEDENKVLVKIQEKGKEIYVIVKLDDLKDALNQL